MEAKLLKQSMGEHSSDTAIGFDNSSEPHKSELQEPEQQELEPDDFDGLLENPAEETEFTVAYIDDDTELQAASDDENKSVTVYEEVEYLESDVGEEVCSVPSLAVVQSTGEKKNICNLCPTPFLFKHEFSLKRHLWDFHGNIGDSDPMLCTTCNFRFCKTQREDTLIRAVQKHQTAHENGKFLCCTFCPELFKSQLRLEQHIEEHKKRLHSDSKFNHKCKACGNFFPNFEELNAHLNETGCREAHERPFKCFICNVSFTMGIKKKEHIQREHLDKAGADCPLCCRCKIPSAVSFENHYSTHFEGELNHCSQIASFNRTLF